MSTGAGKKRLKIGLIIAGFSLAVLALVLLLCEGIGTPVGKFINRPVADSYIVKNYDGIEFEFIASRFVIENTELFGIETETKGYRYEYEVKENGDFAELKAGDRFFIDVYNFSVTADGIFSEYLRDEELCEAVNGYLLDKLKSFDEFENQNIEADKAYFDLRISKGEFEGNTEARLDALLSSEKIGEADCILHFLGDKVSLDEYAVKAAEIAEFFKKNTELKPGFLQIIYYYENNGSRTMQYETRLEFYELEYDKDAIANGIDMHYYIELDENQKTKLRIYNIIKYVYIAVVSVTIVGLSAYWVVKKVMKLKRNKSVEDEIC